MTYEYAIEKRDISKIDKLNKIYNLENYWNEVRKLTNNITSDHSIKRWQCLADVRFKELQQIWLDEYRQSRQYLLGEIGGSTMDFVDAWILGKCGLPTYDMGSDNIECAKDLKRKYIVLNKLGLI